MIYLSQNIILKTSYPFYNQNMSDSKSIIRRLNIIKGQVEGIAKMMEEGRDCKDVIFQIKAVKSGFSNVAEKFIKDHLKECLTKKGKEKQFSEQEFDEILSIFAKL